MFNATDDMYKLSARIDGLDGAVKSLELSPDGRYVSAGGRAGAYVRVFDLEQRAPVSMSVPRTGQWTRGAVVSQAWANLFDENNNCTTVLCFGTALGWIVFWSVEGQELVELHALQIGKAAEITAVAWYGKLHCRGGLVTVTADQVCFRWTYTVRHGLEPHWATSISKTVPMSVFVDERLEGSPSVYVQGIHGARMYKYNWQDGELMRMHRNGNVCGGVDIHWGSKALIVDNGEGDFERRSLGDGSLKRTYEVPHRDERMLPRSIGFVNGGQEFVGGGLGPSVFRFHVGTGEVLQELKHAESGYTQRVATCDVGGKSTIVVGSSADGIPASITVWTRKLQATKRRAKDSEYNPILDAICTIIMVVGLYWMYQGGYLARLKGHVEEYAGLMVGRWEQQKSTDLGVVKNRGTEEGPIVMGGTGKWKVEARRLW